MGQCSVDLCYVVHLVELCMVVCGVHMYSRV